MQEGPGLVDVSRQSKTVKQTFEDIPIEHDVEIPVGCNISESGVWLVKDKKPHQLSPYPLVMTHKYFDLTEQTEKWEVFFKYDGVWKSLIEDRETFCNHNKLIKLSSYSFPVNSANAKMISHFLFNFSTYCNAPKTYIVSRCGWHSINKKKFFCLEDRDWETNMMIV